MALLYVVFGRPYKIKFNHKYCNRLPDTYPPAVMSYLVNGGHIFSRDIIATTLHLVSGGYLMAETPRDPAGLSRHEKYLLDWLLEKPFKLPEIAANPYETAHFRERYGAWAKLVGEDAETRKFFMSRSKAVSFGIIVGAVFILYAAFLLANGFGTRYLFVGILGFYTVFYCKHFRKRTPAGQEHYERWMAFKRFLKDFAGMDAAYAGELGLWEGNFVYSISLGCSKELAAALPAYFKEPGDILAGLPVMQKLFDDNAAFSDMLLKDEAALKTIIK